MTCIAIVCVLVRLAPALTIALALMPGDDLLELLRRRHQAAVDSVQTLECTVEVRDTLGKSQTVTRAKYFRSGNRVRVSESTQKGTIEALLRDGIATSIGHEPGNKLYPVTAAISPGNKWFVHSDCYVNMLLVLPAADSRRPIDQFLDQVHKSRTVQRVREDGRDLVRVEVTSPSQPPVVWSFTAFFDPQVNYLARKLVVARADRPMGQAVTVITRFAEPAPGLFFPVESRFEDTVNGKIESARTVSITGLNVNQPIPESVFTIKIPAGVRVHNRITNTTYQQPGPNQAVPPTASPTSNGGFSGAFIANADGQVATAETRVTDEDTPTWVWVGAGLLTALGLLAFSQALRRRPA
jgi:hypothetical protein